MRDISDICFVLSRTDYGERDRILNILTAQHGKLSVLAKGVRSAKSKLAGGIELFAENKVVLKNSKGDMFILTSARMENYYGKIAKDVEAAGFIYECLKAVNRLVPTESGQEYFPILKGLFTAVEKENIPLSQIKIWFSLHFLKNLGAAPNLKTDSAGDVLKPAGSFAFDYDKQCFFADDKGKFSQDHIKLLRHLESASKPVEIKNINSDLTEAVEKLLDSLLIEHIN